MIYLFQILSALSMTLFTLSCANESAEFADDNSQRRYRPGPEEISERNRIIQQDFATADVFQEDIAITPDLENVRQSLTMEIRPPRIAMLRQEDRPWRQETFKQGHTGTESTESFPALQDTPYDLLIVIDNSNSMTDIQGKLSRGMAALLDQRFLGQTDWQIAVATTDSPCLRSTANGVKTITRDDLQKNPDLTRRQYMELIMAGVNGSNREAGIRMAAEAALGDCGNPDLDWKRPDGVFATLIVSDEKSCGSATNEGCAGMPWESPSYFIERAPPGATVYGLFWLSEDMYNSECSESSGGYEDPRPMNYINLVDQTGGIYEEICRSDYSQVLNQISAHVTRQPISQFTLTHRPEPGTLRITWDGEVQTDYVLDDRHLTVNLAFRETAEPLVVTYRHGAIPLSQSYRLEGQPAPATIEVRIDGVPQPASLWQLDDRQTLTFMSEPPARGLITVRYRQNRSLSNRFDLPKGILEGSVQVEVDDHPVTWHQDDDQMVLSETPADGAQVKVIYNRPEDIVLAYPLDNVAPHLIENVRVIDALTGEEIPAVFDGATMQFEPADVKRGRNVVVDVDIAHERDNLSFSVPFDGNLVEESVAIRTDRDAGMCDRAVELRSGELHFTCDDDAFTTINVEFTTYTNLRNQFDLDVPYADKRYWMVRVDGVTTDRFVREGKTITIDREILSWDSTVSIAVYPEKPGVE